MPCAVLDVLFKERQSCRTIGGTETESVQKNSRTLTIKARVVFAHELPLFGVPVPACNRINTGRRVKPKLGVLQTEPGGSLWGLGSLSPNRGGRKKKSDY
jgi:hypothetical protein